MSLIILLACACGSSSQGASDAGTDAVAEASDVASALCKSGLPSTVTDKIPCGANPCDMGQECCIDAAMCQAQCPNLDLGWQCDRSSHCGAGMQCCLGLPIDFTSCPGASYNTAALCRATSLSCEHQLCQADADCSAGTCYAVMLGGNGRTFGVCH